jgi:hypothetical protein
MAGTFRSRNEVSSLEPTPAPSRNDFSPTLLPLLAALTSASRAGADSTPLTSTRPAGRPTMSRFTMATVASSGTTG